MKCLGILALFLLLCGPAAAQTPMTSNMPRPPVAAQVPHIVKSPHGDRVDEYFWLRDDDPRTKRPEILAYLQAENAYTEAMLAPLAALQRQLLEEMRARIVPDDSTPPGYRQGWWTWLQYAPGAEHPQLMGRRGTPGRPDPRARAQVLLDQPARAQGQPYYGVGSWALSPDGRWLAWTEDTVGQRRYTLRLRDLVRQADLPDAVPGVLDDIAWAADNRTLFYVRQDPVTLQSGPVWRHVRGTPVADDVLVYEEADKTLFVSVAPTASGRWVRIVISGGDTTETRAIDARRPTGAPRVVLQRRDKIRHSADHLGRHWYVRTNEEALNFRLVRAPEDAPELRSRWRTLVPARDDAALEAVVLMRGAIALQERVQAQTRLRLLVDGRTRAVPAPDGSTVKLDANDDASAAHLRYAITSMVQPQAVMDLHLASGEQILRKQRQVPGYDAAQYATERFWAPARDGRRIPVTLAWRRDKARADGTAPLLISGYGAYGYSTDPGFSTTRVSLLDRGFVVALAHVRGGADLGQAWFEDGRKLNKKNSFNDFVDATDALVAAGWGAKDKVFASGGSAGGLLMGAVANQAGDRYRGMLLAVPFVDVVTTMLDETIPLTVQEYSQWGHPHDKAAYDYMLSYSPYDNLRAQPYPAMFVTTGLWDSQVAYWEPAKYVARLRRLKTDTHPLLLETDMTSGHGGASGRYAALERTAREHAFLLALAGLAPWPGVR